MQGALSACDRALATVERTEVPARLRAEVLRTRGTLLCHFRHRFHEDALARVGLPDITSWVDFTAVAAAAQGAGCEVAGYTTQAHFLIGCGLGDFVVLGAAWLCP